MGLDLFEVAYKNYQDRKEAIGAPAIDDVISGEKHTLTDKESVGLLVGTDLDNNDIDIIAQNVVSQALEVGGSERFDFLTLLTSVLCEGLFLGIEYGRLLERQDRNA